MQLNLVLTKLNFLIGMCMDSILWRYVAWESTTWMYRTKIFFLSFRCLLVFYRSCVSHCVETWEYLVRNWKFMNCSFSQENKSPESVSPWGTDWVKLLPTMWYRVSMYKFQNNYMYVYLYMCIVCWKTYAVSSR